MRKFIIFEVSILLLITIAWIFGVISITSLGKAMLGFGVIYIIYSTLALFGTRMLTGDVSIFLKLNEIFGIRTIMDKPSISYIFQFIGAGLIPILIAVIIQLLR